MADGKLDAAKIKGRLQLKGLSDEEVTAFAESIANLEAGLFPVDIFPVGIVQPDRMRTKFHVKPNDLPKLVDGLFKGGLVRPDIQIFPIGIIAPELYEVNATLSSRGR